MTEKDYLLLLIKELRKQAQVKRVICGFNTNAIGEAIVTTGIPKEYKEGQITYVAQKTLSYEDYMTKQFQKDYKRRR